MTRKFITPVGMTAFLVPEVTFMTPVLPAATDAIKLLKGFPLPSQPDDYERGQEVGDSVEVTALLRKIREAGSLSFSTYLRPSGVAGTAPTEKNLLKGLLGTETITPAASAVYTPNKSIGSYNLWMRLDERTVFCAAGLVVAKGKLSGGADKFSQADWDVQFAKLLYAGTTLLSGIHAALEDELTVDNIDRFTVGTFVQVGADTNGGAGYKITDITTRLVITPGLDSEAADDAVVTGFLPDPTVAGVAVEDYFTVKIAGVAVDYDSWSIEIANEIVWQKEVPSTVTDDIYPAGFALVGRTITGEVTAAMVEEDLVRLQADDTDKALLIDGSAFSAGNKASYSLPQGRYTVPSIESGAAAFTFTTKFLARATAAGNDTMSASYT